MLDDEATGDLQVRLHNHGKRVVTPAILDAATIGPIVARADVLVTSLTGDRLDELALARTTCGRVYPRLIHAHVTPYGSDYTGPVASDDAAFYTRSGTTGLMSEDVPLRFGPGQAARSGAFAAAAAILGELHRRDRTGRAGSVESSLLASGMYSIANDVTVAQGSGAQPSRYDRTRPLNALGNSYLCADGKWVLLGVASAGDAWNRFRAIVDDDAWMNDAAFADVEGRRANVDVLVQRLEAEFARHPRSEWGSRLSRAKINWNPIADLDDVIADTQFAACGVFIESDAGPSLTTPIFMRDQPHEARPTTPFDLNAWPHRLAPSDTVDGPDLPLDGIRVLDTSHYVAGPALGSLLVDLGAEVIKVEPPGGDPRRGALPHLVAGDPPGLNRSYHMDNRGKRSIEVDFSDPTQLQRLKRLAASCDVFLTNLLPQRQRKYGLQPDDLLAANPAQVHVSLTAHGSAGPDAELGGFDLTAFFARSGILGSLTGQVGVPPRSRSGQGDHIATLVLMTGLLAALRLRNRTGAGQAVETSLLATGTYTIGEDLLRTRLGLDPHAEDPLDSFYRCADGRWLRLASSRADANDRARLLRTVSVPSADAIAERLTTDTAEAWIDLLVSHGIPAMGVPQLPEVLDDPIVARAQILGTINVPDVGEIGTVGAPFRFHAWSTRPFENGPAMGADTATLFTDAAIKAPPKPGAP